jgi:hypothetical protein
MVLDKPQQSSQEGINQQRDKAVRERRDFLYDHRDQNDQVRPVNIEEKLTHVLPDIRKDLENLRKQEIPPAGHQPEILAQRERQVDQIIERFAQLGTELKEALQELGRKSLEEQKWNILKKWAENSLDSRKDIKSGADSLDPKKLKEMQQSLDVLLESAKDEARNIEAHKYIGKLKDEYPEYDPNSIRAGITWSKDRLSLKPSLKRFESCTVNPMHGLAVYAESSTGKEYAGIAQYRNL